MGVLGMGRLLMMGEGMGWGLLGMGEVVGDGVGVWDGGDCWGWGGVWDEGVGGWGKILIWRFPP